MAGMWVILSGFYFCGLFFLLAGAWAERALTGGSRGQVSAAASVGDGRSPLATIAPLEKLYIILKLEIPLPLRRGLPPCRL